MADIGRIMRSDRLKLNVLSNFAATGSSAILNLIFVPIYIHLLGIEAYGLVGLYATLQAMLTLLDLGFTPTMSREMARYSVLPAKSQEARDLARTLEVIYWIIAIVIGAGIIALSSPIAEYWIQSRTLSSATVRQAIIIMGLIAALQWPVTFYAGGLQGLQDQLLLNSVNIVVSTLRFGGAALIIWLVSPTVIAFFIWQIVTSGLQTSLLFSLFWWRLPSSLQRPYIRLHLLRSIWRFAASMGGISIISLLLMQTDKLLLSRMLPLDQFGYYILANMLAQSLLLLSGPVTNAVFPRLTQLISKGNQAAVIELFHHACQFVSVGVLPIGMLLTLFSPEIILIWTHDKITVQQTYLLVSLLSIGSMFLAIQTIPYMLALASGWMKLNLYLGVISIAIIIPLLFILVAQYGSVGAGIAWIVLNGATTPIYIHLLYRNLLPGEEWRWYVKDIGAPLIAVVGVMTLGRWLTNPNWSPTLLGVSLASITVIAIFFAALTASDVRHDIITQLQQVKIKWNRQFDHSLKDFE